MKNTFSELKYNELNDNETAQATGAGEFIGFIDSDDFEEKETYEAAYKYSRKEGFAGREISPLN